MGYWDLIDPYWEKISIYDGPAKFLAQFTLAPEAIGHLYASHFAQSEICNGGMHQLFWNDTGVLVPEAISGFRALNLDILADPLANAAKLLASPYPRECPPRRKILETMPSDAFRAFDDIFFAQLDPYKSPNAYEHAADAYAQSMMTGPTDLTVR